MGLSVFECDSMIKNSNLNVVVCINQRKKYADKSPINHMMEILQLSLKNELSDYDRIHIAFVYETPGIDVRKFQDLSEDSRLFYKEPCDKLKDNRIKHLLFMALALLEIQHQKEPGENRLYLLSDERLDRIAENDLAEQVCEHSSFQKRFKDLNYKPFLFTNQKPKTLEEGTLEQFFKSNQGEILYYNKEM